MFTSFLIKYLSILKFYLKNILHFLKKFLLSGRDIFFLQFRKFPEQLLLSGGHPRWNFNNHLYQEIAPPIPMYIRKSFSTNRNNFVVLRSFWYLYLNNPPRKGRNINGITQGCLCKSNRNFTKNVIPMSFKDRMGSNMDVAIQISRSCSIFTRLSLACQPQPCSILNASWNLNRNN